MNFSELLLKRESVRRYSDKPVATQKETPRKKIRKPPEEVYSYNSHKG